MASASSSPAPALIFATARVTGRSRRARNRTSVGSVLWLFFAIEALRAHTLWGELVVLGLALGTSAGVFAQLVRAQRALEAGTPERQPGWLTSEGALVLDDHALRIGNRCVVARADVKGALAKELRSGEGLLQIAQRGDRSAWAGPIMVTLPSLAEAEALQRALGEDGSSAVAELAAASPLERASIGVTLVLTTFAAVAIGYGSQDHPWVWLLPAPLFAMIFVLLGLLNVAATVRIGTDAVEHRWLGRKRLVCFRDLVAVHETAGGARLELRGGSTLTWRFADAALVLTRLRRALAASQAPPAGDDEGWLLRKAKTDDEWVRDLRALGSGQARGYRVAPPSREALWRIVEDPAGEASLRAASAVALGSLLDEAERARLRVAARVTIAPDLRRVFEGEADADDDAAEALAVVERGRASVAVFEPNP